MEYAIWGIPPRKTEETLLVAMPNGKPITSRADAERYADAMGTKYQCTHIRIQTIDGSLPAFGKQSLATR